VRLSRENQGKPNTDSVETQIKIIKEYLIDKPFFKVVDIYNEIITTRLIQINYLVSKLKPPKKPIATQKQGLQKLAINLGNHCFCLWNLATVVTPFLFLQKCTKPFNYS
jgi:hypothetical protein